MTTTTTDLAPMNADDFIAWAMSRPDAEHYELHDGDVVRMPNEASLHGLTKAEITYWLMHALKTSSLPCDVYVDAMVVEIGPGLVFEPDIVVRCADRLPNRATKITDPIIVVEVISPSSRKADLGRKETGYLSLPSLRHYLVVDAETRTLTHFRRGDDGVFAKTPHGDGPLRLDPPGITIAKFFP
jgi:Uma2 family endonuclease